MRSIAFLRAVVVSHAPGFSGTPSRSQWSTASATASCSASSARSKSPHDRISVATMRPCSWRKTAASASEAALIDGLPLGYSAHRAHLGAALLLHLREVDHRPDLDAARLDVRELLRPLDRRVQVRGIEDVEPAQLLFRLRERPVCHLGLPATDSDGLRRGHGVERLATLLHTRRDGLRVDREPALYHLRRVVVAGL